jgi:FtsZ-interacting cell division protein YlmF
MKKKQTEKQDNPAIARDDDEDDDDDEVSNLQTQTKVVPYNEENEEKKETRKKPQVIGYSRGSFSTINYAKLTRINIATFTTSSTSTIIMIPENPNDSTGSDIDLIALLGPKVWDGSGVEYCLLSSTSCFQHDTTKVRPSVIGCL